MNNTQMELYMKDLAEMFTKAHNEHMDVIRRYSEGFLSFEAYKVMDIESTAKVEAIRKVIASFLARKNA